MEAYQAMTITEQPNAHTQSTPDLMWYPDKTNSNANQTYSFMGTQQTLNA